MRALGIAPAVYHLNEGHSALGVFELMLQARAEGWVDDPWGRVREQVVFTTHTPVPAGNETYQRSEVLGMLGRIADLVGDREQFLVMGRIDPGNPNQHGAVADVPITHVTNGVHIPTWLQGTMRELLDRYLGEGWLTRADQSVTWHQWHEVLPGRRAASLGAGWLVGRGF